MIFPKKKSHETVDSTDNRAVEKQAESAMRRFELALRELDEALKSSPSKPKVRPKRNN